MENSIFEEAMESNENSSDNLLISPSIQLNPSEYTFAAGIEIEVDGLHIPIFLSSDQLRALAQEADNIASQMIGNNDGEQHTYH